SPASFLDRGSVVARSGNDSMKLAKGHPSKHNGCRKPLLTSVPGKDRAMIRSLLTACALLLPVPAWAERPERPPETFLAAAPALSLRFAGLEPPRPAYERTALAETMKGDLGPLADHFLKEARDFLGSNIIKDRLLKGVTPDQLLQQQAAAKQVPHLLDYLGRHGFALGVEVISLLPPRAQLTVIFPQAGRDAKDRDAIFAGLRLLALTNQKPLRETKQGERLMLELPFEGSPVRLACWQEQGHVVLILG